MTIRRELHLESEIQSFAVSDGSILVPFTHDARYGTWNGKIYPGNIDYNNSTVMCLPKEIYDELRRDGALDDIPSFFAPENEATSENKERGFKRQILLSKYMIAVEILTDGKNTMPYTLEDLSSGGYLVRITSDREYPYKGIIIPGSRAAKRSMNGVPKSVGQGRNEDDIPVQKESDKFEEAPATPDRTQLEDLRNSFFQKLNSALNASRNIENMDIPPFRRKHDTNIIFGHNNHTYVDIDNRQFGVHLAKDEQAQIGYDGEADLSFDRSRIRKRGTPTVAYDKDGLVENNMQEVTHSTFFTPVKRFSNSLGTTFSDQMPHILQLLSFIKG